MGYSRQLFFTSETDTASWIIYQYRYQSNQAFFSSPADGLFYSMLDPEIWIHASNWVFFFFFINITFSVFCLCRFYFILCLPIQAKANSTHFCFCQISLQQWIQFHIIPILIVFRTVVLQTLLSGTSQCSCPRRQIFWEQKRRELFILVSLFATQTSRLLSNDCVLTDRVISSQPPR